MKVKWKKWKGKSTPPTVLLKQIKGRLDVSSTGQIAFRTDFGFLLDALFEKVDHSFTLDEESLFDVFKWATIDTLVNSSSIQPDKILSAFQKECHKINQNKEKFVLVTSVGLKNKHLPKRRQINGCTINFSQDLPEKYRSARNKIISDSIEEDFADQEDFLFVCVSVEAPNKATALKKALETIDLIRSLWHIGFIKKVYLFSEDKEKEYFTDSIVSTGKLHTLHSKTGKSIPGAQWKEKYYKDKKAIIVKDFALTERLLDRQLRQIKRSPFQSHITCSLISYINALDYEQELRFMKLWSVLEQLLKTDESEELIKRIAFFFKDRDTEKSVLRSLRISRNVNAHVGSKPLNIEIKNFRLSQYTECILKFFIDNPLKCKSLSELISIASLSTDSTAIDKQIKNLLVVKKFIEDNP